MYKQNTKYTSLLGSIITEVQIIIVGILRNKREGFIVRSQEDSFSTR